jgi:hypothetical protein
MDPMGGANMAHTLEALLTLAVSTVTDLDSALDSDPAHVLTYATDLAFTLDEARKLPGADESIEDILHEVLAIREAMERADEERPARYGAPWSELLDHVFSRLAYLHSAVTGRPMNSCMSYVPRVHHSATVH